MAIIGVTRETKSKLLGDAAQGRGIEKWMFLFIRHDPEFQAELFKTAEDAQNWQFLSSLSDFREEQRAEKEARLVQAACTRAGKERKQPKAKNRHSPKIQIRPPKKRGSSPKPQIPQAQHAPVPAVSSLPAHLVMHVHPTDFIHCPRCRIRILKKVLRDHLELACAFRGRSEGTSAGTFHFPKGKGVCFCGAPVMPGEVFCYEHKAE